MGPFANRTETISADSWGEGEEVVIRELSWGEINRLQQRAIAPEGLTPGDAKRAKADPEGWIALRVDELRVERLLAAIVSWSFKDQNGDLVPVTRESINALREDYGDFIAEEVDKLNPQRDEEFQSGDRDEGDNGPG